MSYKHNFRLHEPWMSKGLLVQMPNNTGVIENVVSSRIGKQWVVLKVSIRPTGVKQAFPFNPNDIEQVKQ